MTIIVPECVRKLSQRGFTLIEMMVALSILSFGMLAVTAMFTASIKANAQGKHTTEASSLAQSRLDKLLTAVDYDNLEVEAVTEQKLDAKGVPNTGPYTRVTTVNALTGINAKMIKVKVSWTSHVWKNPSSGESEVFTRNVELSTVRAKD